MKAVVYSKYGSPEELELKEVEKPIPGNDEVLIKVKAASVNNWDWDRLTGKPFLYRLLTGIFKPRLPILGADVAGVVEAVGQNIRDFKPGDEVFGDLCDGNWGAFAEYVCANENSLNIKPPSISFEEAAAIPQAGVMALQGLRKRNLQAGDKVLMNGAGGGVGSFVIQMAKMLDLEITAVDTSTKFDFMRALGADHVIDYTKENFTKNGKKYDLIIDVVANQSVLDYKHALSNDGVYTMIGGKIPSVLQIGLIGPLVSQKRGKRIGILPIQPNSGVLDILNMIDQGGVKPIIDKVFPLEKTAEALQHIGDGHVKGKVVIRVDS